MTTMTRKFRNCRAWRVAATIAAILIAGSSLDRALADAPAKPRSGASRAESTGVLSGLAIGAAAGGPFGAIFGAAGGAWLGERLHRQETDNQKLTGDVGDLSRERARLSGEIERLNDTLSSLEANLADSALQLAALEANSIPLDALAANVHFRTRDARLAESDVQSLRQLGAALSARTTRTVHVTGFADARGAAGYNYELSTARAEAVADALVEGGLSREQIVVVGAGAPAHSNCLQDSERCAFERRASLRMVESGDLSADEQLAQVAP